MRNLLTHELQTVNGGATLKFIDEMATVLSKQISEATGYDFPKEDALNGIHLILGLAAGMVLGGSIGIFYSPFKF